jgi:hypothetical protein
MLYNPGIMQHQQQNFMFQRTYNQIGNNNLNGNKTTPTNHLQMHVFANKAQQQPQQQPPTNNVKAKVKEYSAAYNLPTSQQNGNMKNNIITDTFIKPITNYIIPTLYNSRLESHDVRTKGDAAKQATKPEEKPTSSGSSNNSNPKNLIVPVTPANQQSRKYGAVRQANDQPANSIKLILNSAETKPVTISPFIKPLRIPGETGHAQIKSPPVLSPTKCVKINQIPRNNQNDNLQATTTNAGSKPELVLQRNHQDSNYAFILHEKPDIQIKRKEPDRLFATMNELEASMIKAPNGLDKNSPLNQKNLPSKKAVHEDNRKPRFKTIHIEPSLVREAAERNREASGANTLSKPSKNGYQVLDNRNVDKLSTFMTDYKAVEKEINNFYAHINGNVNKIETAKPIEKERSKKTTRESESMKSSLNSVLSTSSQNNAEQHNHMQPLPTSGYSSFNSQKSNKPKPNGENPDSNSTANKTSDSSQPVQKPISPTKPANLTVAPLLKEKIPTSSLSTAVKPVAQAYDKTDMLPVVENLIQTLGTPTKDEVKKPAYHASRAKSKVPNSVLQNYKSPVRVIKIQKPIAKPDRKSKSQEPNNLAQNMPLRPLSVAAKQIVSESKSVAGEPKRVSKPNDDKTVLPPSEIARVVIEAKEPPKTTLPISIDVLKKPSVENDLKKEAAKPDASKPSVELKPNKIPIKIRTKPTTTEKSVKIHHGVPPPPVVVSRPLQLRSKHISISPTKRKSLYETEKQRLMANKSTTNQIEDTKRFDQFKEELIQDHQNLKKTLPVQDTDKPTPQPVGPVTNQKYQNIQNIELAVKVESIQQSQSPPAQELKLKAPAEKVAEQHKMLNPSQYQQKFGTLQTPNRRIRHSIFTQVGQQTLNKRLPYDPSDKSYSIVEEYGTNKTNLPNLNGVDYYYKSRNENKFVFSWTKVFFFH